MNPASGADAVFAPQTATSQLPALHRRLLTTAPCNQTAVPTFPEAGNPRPANSLRGLLRKPRSTGEDPVRAPLGALRGVGPALVFVGVLAAGPGAWVPEGFGTVVSVALAVFARAWLVAWRAYRFGGVSGLRCESVPPWGTNAFVTIGW
jgi:hypothetical protein